MIVIINAFNLIDGVDGSNKGISIPVNIDNRFEFSIGIWFQIADTSKTYQTGGFDPINI